MGKAITLNIVLSLLLFCINFFSFYLTLNVSLEIGLAMNILIYALLLFYLVSSRRIVIKFDFELFNQWKSLISLVVIFAFISILLNVFLNPLYNLPYIFGEENIKLSPPLGVNYSKLFIIQAVFFAPILEELIFRKFLLVRTLKLTGRKVFSIILTSAVFALIHLPSWTVCIGAFFLGVLSCILYLRTKKIIISVVFHFMFNLISIYISSSTNYDIYVEILNILNFGIFYWIINLTAGLLVVLFIRYYFLNLNQTMN